jgi:hypothetical protein
VTEKLTIEDFKSLTIIPEVGERRKDKIHLAAGRAIHQWEVVEHYLGALFGDLLGTTIPVGALRAYGAMSGFSARQQMLSQAAEAFFYYAPNEGLQVEFNRIVKSLCVNASARRNEIAHGLVVSQNKGAGESYFLVPSFHSTKKRSFAAEPAYQYTSKEIEIFTRKFRLLAGEVHRLSTECLTWHEAQKKRSR